MKPTQEQVIAWAWEASKGMLSYDAEGEWRLSQTEAAIALTLAYEAGRKDENEECAKVALDYDQHAIAPAAIAAAIRARREQ